MHVEPGTNGFWVGILFVIPLILGWLVIYTAVLTALRRHDRD